MYFLLLYYAATRWSDETLDVSKGKSRIELQQLLLRCCILGTVLYIAIMTSYWTFLGYCFPFPFLSWPLAGSKGMVKMSTPVHQIAKERKEERKNSKIK